MTCFFTPTYSLTQVGPYFDWTLQLVVCLLAHSSIPTIHVLLIITEGWTLANYNSHTHFPAEFQPNSTNRKHSRKPKGKTREEAVVYSLSPASHLTPFKQPTQQWLSLRGGKPGDQLQSRNLSSFLVPHHPISPFVPPALKG